MQSPSTPPFSGEFPLRPQNAAGHRIAYAELLNPSQLQAVTHAHGPLLVIAGAGSGKTRTLTYRVARLVEQGVSPQSILLLSFTRKASQEMLTRAVQLLDNRCQQVTGGTFHSFANSILRRHASKIGFENNFIIIDRSDSEELIGMIRKEYGNGDESGQLPRKGTLASLFSRSVNKSLPLEEVLYEEFPHFGFLSTTIQEIWKEYQRRKRSHQFCDYDDLLVYLHQLLRDDAPLRENLAQRYEHILVDEYQDTNQIQAEIVYLLAGGAKNVMAVGDDSQSIYAFRGANFKNILTFPERFPGTTIIKLEENYRSRQPILNLTNEIIDQAAEKYSKRLYSKRGEGALPRLVAASDENAQSRYVVDQVCQLISTGVPLKEIGVLFRASFNSFDLELELAHHSIPFIKVGGFKFAESAHIKDLLALLRIFATPRDRLSWNRVLLLLDKIGPKTADRIYSSIMEKNAGPAGLLQIKLSPKLATSLIPLKELVSEMQTAPLTVQGWGERMLTYYLPYLKTGYDDHPRRIKDLEQLLTIMGRYETVDAFLADMALEPPNATDGDRLTSPDELETRLTLSTVHSAKGLEWHTVMIIWALDGRFPSHHSIDNPESLEEERRLMYVAATRARENLHIIYPAQVFDRTTNSFLYRPSRFLEDIPENLLQRHFYRPGSNRRRM